MDESDIHQIASCVFLENKKILSQIQKLKYNLRFTKDRPYKIRYV